MFFDVFFSISQTPVKGITPSEREMLQNFFEQVSAADECGFETAWVAESHLSTEVQKHNPNPVVPHWRGEIGLNADITQLAHQIFARTRNIEVGSAVMNLLVNGGPIAAAERLATFAALHGLNAAEKRRLRVGFAQGRFDFMNRAFGITPRNPIEECLWPTVKGRVFQEASEIFLRLLAGETLSSEQVAVPPLHHSEVKDPTQWEKALKLAGEASNAEHIPLDRRYVFEPVKIIPQDFRRELLDLVVGSHSPALQKHLNTICPVKIFNLSITQPEVIQNTHDRMQQDFHPEGGGWKREHMPRTVMVFLNAEEGLSESERNEHAKAEAKEALGAYWTALEGTLDPEKVRRATDNAVVGAPSDIVAQQRERFHPDDRLMLWFDFFNHDSKRVMRNMSAFSRHVAPHFRAGGKH